MPVDRHLLTSIFQLDQTRQYRAHHRDSEPSLERGAKDNGGPHQRINASTHQRIDEKSQSRGHDIGSRERIADAVTAFIVLQKIHRRADFK